MTRPDEPEDRLRALLQESAEQLVPRGDGLARIQERLAARRSRRRVLAPALVLTGVVAVAAAGAYGAQLTRPDVVRPPAVTPTADPQPTDGCTGLCTSPRPSSSPSEAPAPSALGVPIWPYATEPRQGEQVPAWTSDPAEVALRFVSELLELQGVTSATPTSRQPSVTRVRLRVGTREAGLVRLVQLGADGPWSVTGVTAPGLDVSVPEEVSSPQAVSGRVDGVDQSVHVQLVATRPGTTQRVLVAEEYAPAGAEQPWQARLTWDDDAWDVGAVAASTADGNGVLLHVHVTAVRPASGPRPPTAGTAFVATEGGKVVLVDATTGRRTRQLSFPTEGRTDSQPTRGGRDGVVFVRSSADGCSDTQLVRIGLTDGPAGVTVRRDGYRLGAPSMSDDGRWLAWVQTPCGEGGPVVVLRGPDAVERGFTAREEPTELDVADDGSVVVVSAAGVRLATAQSWPGRLLEAGSGCRLTSAARATRDVVAFEACAEGVRAVRYSFAGERGSAGPHMADVEPVRRTAVAAGRVLLWAGEDGFIGELVAPNAVSTISAPEGCASDQQPEGCFAFPDW